MRKTMMLKGHIVNEGMGGFLNPPAHPEHILSVKGSRDEGGSLSYIAYDPGAASYWDEETVQRARNILETWTPLPLDHPDVEDWVRQVMGYFRGCYGGDRSLGEQRWNVQNLLIDSELDPMENEDEHAGVHYIRKWYPEFRLSREILDEAYWGKKP